MLWFSAILVVILGGLTIWLHDARFIKMKPTLYYALLAGLLAFGLATDKPLLQRGVRTALIPASTKPAGSS